MARITVKQLNGPVLCEDGANLLDQLLREGPLWIIPAVGKESVENAKSGSCRERPVKMSDTEKNLLKEQEIRRESVWPA